MGCKVQDTAELSFVDVRVPAANLLGEEGEAFGYLGHNLPRSASPSPSDRSRRPAGDRRDHRLREGPQGVRHNRSPRSRTPSSNWPRARRRWRPPRRCSTGR